MKRSSLALLTSLFFAPAAAYAESVARVKQFSEPQSQIENEVSDEVLAARSLAALKRLEKEVLVYRSFGDFEANGKLARVSYQTFKSDLAQVTAEVEPLLSRMPKGKLKTELTNALASFQDGEFWWQKIDRPRIVNVSALTSNLSSRPPANLVFADTVPYTVTIHWRQATRYLKRAAQLMGTPTTLSAMRVETSRN
jgi:hypothetical protein